MPHDTFIVSLDTVMVSVDIFNESSETIIGVKWHPSNGSWGDT